MNNLCELCAGELGNLRYTITQRTGIHVFLNIRNIPYFSTVVTLCCHTSQDLSYMLSQHHPTSFWTHLGHSSRVFVCITNFLETFLFASQRIWVLMVLDSWKSFEQCKKTHLITVPRAMGLPERNLVERFLRESLSSHAADVIDVWSSDWRIWFIQMPENNRANPDCWLIKGRHLPHFATASSGCFFCFAICVLGTFPFANRKLEAQVWKIMESDWKDLHVDKADIGCGFNFPSYCSHL